jgi:hypothetical protein
VSGRQSHPEAAAGRGLAPGQSIQASTQGVGAGPGQVEAVAGPVGVDGDQPAIGVDQRTAGRTPA